MLPEFGPNDRLFLAHPISADKEEIEAWIGEIHMVPGVASDTEVISAQKSMRTLLSSLGSYESWYRYIAAGSLMGGWPVYTAVICPREWVGMRTQRIVTLCLAAQKPLFLLKDGELVKISGCEIDPECERDEKGQPVNWASGWHLLRA